MIEIYSLLLILVSGFTAGILIGLLGIGGGLLFVPFLYLILPSFGISPKLIPFVAIATSLFSGSIGSIISSVKHYIAKNSIIPKAIYLSSGSLVSALLTPLLVVESKPVYLQYIFAIVFVLIAAKMFWEENRKPGEQNDSNEMKDIHLIPIGFLVGVVAAFTGLGGGLLYVPVLHYLSGLRMKFAIGTSAIVTAVTMIASTLSFSLLHNSIISNDGFLGYIYLPVAIPLGIGAAFGAFFGVRLFSRTKHSILRKIFSVLLIVVVIKIIFQL